MKLAIALATSCAIAVPASARVDVTVDMASLNEMITKMAPSEVPVDLGMGKILSIRLDDLKVTGFDPAGAGGKGVVKTAVRVKVPDLGVDLPVEPKLSLQFREGQGKKVAYLRFEEAKITLPVTGAINLASLLPILPIVSDNAWIVQSTRGKMRMEPKLVDARLTTNTLQLAFDLAVSPEP